MRWLSLAAGVLISTTAFAEPFSVDTSEEPPEPVDTGEPSEFVSAFTDDFPSAEILESLGDADDTSLDAIVPEMSPEILEAAIARLAREKNRSGLRLMGRERYPEALIKFRDAHALLPQDPEIMNNLGYAHALLGNDREAERLYRIVISMDATRAVAYLNLSDLLLQRASGDMRVLQEAAELLVTTRELLGNSARVILRQARVAMLMKDPVSAERFYIDYSGVRRPTGRVALEIGDFYRDLRRLEEAAYWYRRVEASELRGLVEERLFRIDVDAQNLALGWTSSEPPATVARIIENAGHYAQKGRYETAGELFQQAITLAPTVVDALVGYADLLVRMGDPGMAEVYYLRAVSVKLDDPDVYVKLAELYLSADQPQQHAMAVLFLQRALDLRPQSSEVAIQLAQAQRETGNFIGAMESLNRVLSRDGQNPRIRKEALAMKRLLSALIPDDELFDSLDGADLMDYSARISPAMRETLREVKAHLQRGRTGRAMALLRGLPESERVPLVLNLESRILLGAGRTDEAIPVLEASLELDPQQPLILEQLGLALLEIGDPESARRWLVQSEAMGNAGATFLLARLEATPRPERFAGILLDLRRFSHLQRASARLDQVLRANPASIYRHEAHGLFFQLEERFRRIRIFVMVCVGVLIGLLLLTGYRLWGGIDLKRLILDYPETGIHVQRILSAVRHEVLKHNTMMLVGLVEAIQNAEDVSERVHHFRKQMLGDGKGGVAARLDQYMTELSRIGRTHRRRLNLRRRDAATSRLMRGMGYIRRNRSRLDQWELLSDRKRAAVCRDLKTASDLLNVDGYEAIRHLLDNLRTLALKPSMIRRIYDDCCMETSFQGVVFAPLQLKMEIPEGGLRLSVSAAGFQDILSNLIRNAIQSTLLYGDASAAVGVGIFVSVQMDQITGIERMVMQVADESRRKLTLEMLRGRYIEEGLGLTADLITRYDGTLDVVERDDEWTKAVVVKLPIASGRGAE